MPATLTDVGQQLSIINQDAGQITIYDCRTPNFLLPAGSLRLFVRCAFYVNGTVRVGRMQIYKASSASIFG